jgi:hypothetical protein
MQAWQSVKVENPESAWHGQAGTVIRVEKKGDLAMVQVRMDADGSTEPFLAEELKVL